MTKYLLPFIFLPLLVFSPLVSAETKTFVKEYSYQASEYDSKVSCRALALEQVKRLLLEELGTYLESETEVKNFQLTKDQIITLTADIVRAEITDEKWDGKTYSLKAKMAVDPSDVYKAIDNLRQDRQKIKELEETRKRADEALKEIERLRKELEIAKAEKPNLSEYNKEVNGLSAIDWYEKGCAFQNNGNYKQAVEAYSRAIGLDPKYVYASNNRGAVYGTLGNYQQAIRDCDKAIELDPKFAEAYSNRGNAYNLLGNYQQAIRDCDKAIELDPEVPGAHLNRGVAYYKLGNDQQSIENLKIAARLGDESAQKLLRIRGISW